MDIELAEFRSSKLGNGIDAENLSSKIFLKRMFSMVPRFCWEQDNGNWRQSCSSSWRPDITEHLLYHKKKWEKVLVYRQFLEYLAILLSSIYSSNVLIWLHIAFWVIKVAVYQKCDCLHFQKKCKTCKDFTFSAVICYSTNYAYNFKIRWAKCASFVSGVLQRPLCIYMEVRLNSIA